MSPRIAPLLAATLGLAQMASAEGLQEHTFLVAWASQNCEGFEYAPDLARHALADVQSAPKAEVEALAKELIGGLEVLHDGNMAEICDTAIFLIENPEEE